MLVVLWCFDSSDSRHLQLQAIEGSAARTTNNYAHALQDTSANGHDPDHFSALFFGDLA